MKSTGCKEGRKASLNLGAAGEKRPSTLSPSSRRSKHPEIDES